MTTSRSPLKIIPRAFPGIKPDEVGEIIAQSRVKSYSAGTVICREDALEATFYMILEGNLEVTKVINNSEVRLLQTLTPGDFFGEMALIHNAPRAATVITKTDVVLLELEKEGFERVLIKSPSVALAMVHEISDRLRQNDQMAVEDLRMRAGELAVAYQQLAEQEHIRHEFLTTLAHELRTPLMTANGYLQLLQKGAVSQDQLAGVIDTIARNANQIASLVNDILFLQEIELVLPEFQNVDINAIARSVAANYKEKAEARGIQLKVREENVPPVNGDAKSLERALTALVDNAIKFSPHGGEAQIEVSIKNSKIIIAVTDHGIGIAPEVMPNIFNRFYHLEKSGDDLFGGLGLGLSIAHQVIKQHGGMLDVESKPGRGSTFTITLQAGN
ncbi:MAG: ATP-binding protein [Anaerolineales bacterium]|nr:ATP-binding protein [Anaerolineales bacterium]